MVPTLLIRLETVFTIYPVVRRMHSSGSGGGVGGNFEGSGVHENLVVKKWLKNVVFR